MHPASRKLSSRLLYTGLALFALLLAATVLRVREDWQGRVAGGRARAFYELVHGYIPNRPTDTPGAIAWLHRELGHYLASDAGTATALGSDLAVWQDYRAIPSVFRDMGDVLAAAPRVSVDGGEAARVYDGAAADGSEPLFRDQFYAALGESRFVVTRRRALGGADLGADSPSNAFLRASLAHLHDLRARLPQPSPDGPRLARLYTLCEDGMLTTLPYAEQGVTAEQAVMREGRALRRMPKLPNFVSNEFFFIFDYGAESLGKPFFSGLYLDIGGQGLIATLTAPLVFEDQTLKGVVGMDLSFDLDWHRFAASVPEPLVMEAVTLDDGVAAEGRRPWRAMLETGLIENDVLRSGIAHLARGEFEDRHFHNPSPIFHGVVPGIGALVAFRARDTTWMVTLFPENHPQFPLLSILLLSALFLVLLAGFEWNRRRAEAAQAEAVREFEEKQNLLETMRVPLIVVDPNTERVVYSNKTAQALGIHKDGSFADVIAPDDAVRAHYQRMQVAGAEDRRAYGLPLLVGDRTRYAVIRSVAVRAPIHMIGADERHRLGILFLIEPEEDLHLLTGALVDRTAKEERRKLSGLLSHGVDTLARVLAHRLAEGRADTFDAWLADYIQRRIGVVAWLMDQWSRTEPLPRVVVIRPENVRATVARLEEVFQTARRDRGLRARLHWNNGLLAGDADQTPVVACDIRWSDAFCFALPIRGGLGLFLSEVLINAVRHGAPGAPLRFQVVLDPLRRTLSFRVENAVATPEDPTRLGRKYGGRAILERLATLFGWQALQFTHEGDRYVVSWQVAVARWEPDGEDD